MLSVHILKNGKVDKVDVVSSTNDNVGFNEAAIEAMKRVSWKPALRQGKPVAVAVNIPVIFKLKK